jgi:Putative lumazine-binding
MNRTFTDSEQIAARIDDYVQGCRTGDGMHLKAAFHPDARMFGAVGPDRYDVPVFGGMDAAVAGRPTVDHDARILSIDVEGDAAAVKLAESRFWGQDFVDYFLLSRIDGEWQIVAKSFAHTGPSE